MPLGRKNETSENELTVAMDDNKLKLTVDGTVKEALMTMSTECDHFKAKALQLINGRFTSKSELKRTVLMLKRATKDLEDQIFFLRKAL